MCEPCQPCGSEEPATWAPATWVQASAMGPMPPASGVIASAPQPGAAGDGQALAEQASKAVLDGIRLVDVELELGPADHHAILQQVTQEVLDCLAATRREVLDEPDFQFIRRRVAWLILSLESPEELRSGPRRFQKRDRVICKLGDGEWAAGVVEAVNHNEANIADNKVEEGNESAPMSADPSESFTEQPYVVQLDHPPNTMLSIPHDSNFCVRAEVCFGRGESALFFTRICMGRRRQASRALLRFKVGERVCCAVEDATGNFSDWVAGTVLALHHIVDEWEDAALAVPYQVQLDSGGTVLVHRDEDWLVRDLSLQPEGPRQAEDGTRCLNRFVKRQRDGQWEMIDHKTCKVRPCSNEPDLVTVGGERPTGHCNDKSCPL